MRGMRDVRIFWDGQVPWYVGQPLHSYGIKNKNKTHICNNTKVKLMGMRVSEVC